MRYEEYESDPAVPYFLSSERKVVEEASPLQIVLSCVLWATACAATYFGLIA